MKKKQGSVQIHVVIMLLFLRKKIGDCAATLTAGAYCSSIIVLPSITCAYRMPDHLSVQFLVDGSFQLTLGGMCYRGVPAMSHIRAGRVANPPHGLDVGEKTQRKETNTRRCKPCRENVGQNTDRARFLGDFFADLDANASRSRHGAERADPRSRPLRARRGHASAKKPPEKGDQVRLRTKMAVRLRP